MSHWIKQLELLDFEARDVTDTKRELRYFYLFLVADIYVTFILSGFSLNSLQKFTANHG